MELHICNSSMWEAEPGGLLQSETLPQKKNKKKQRREGGRKREVVSYNKSIQTVSLSSQMLRRLRQEDGKFKAYLGYRVSLGQPGQLIENLP